MGGKRQYPETCSVRGCEEPVYARGRCNPCYQTWRRTGSDPVRTRTTAEVRLERKLARRYAREVTRQEHDLIRNTYLNAGGR